MESPTPRGRTRPMWATLLTGLMLVLGCGESGETPTGGDDDPPGDGNRPPVAAAGADLTVSAGLPVTLDASGSSDPDGDAITVSWALATPGGSAAALDDPASVTPTFTPDVTGSYVATATVSDGTDTSADSANVTAEDNSASATVTAAGGGTVASTDGLFTLDVPAGALAEDTEIRVTRVADPQLPHAAVGVADLTAVYDLQPSGLVFSDPAQVSVMVENAFTADADMVEATAVVLYSESEGVVEPLEDIVLVPDDVDPTRGVVTGDISHFSSAFITRPQGLTFVLTAPSSGTVVEQFESDWADYAPDELLRGLVAVGADNTPFASIDSVTHENVPAGTVEADPEFDRTLELTAGFYRAGNDYICSDAGAGKIRSRIRVDATYGDGVPAVVTVQLAQDVICAAGLQGSFTSLMRAPNNLVHEPGRSNVTFGGDAAQYVEVGSGTLVSLLESRFNGGDPAGWVNRLDDGTYLIHSLLGRPYWGDPTQDTVIRVHGYDQPRDTHQPSPTRVLVASAFGDLGIMDYVGGTAIFTDQNRELSQDQQIGKQTDNQLLQVWGDDTGVILGVRVRGNGDAAFERSDVQLWDADGSTFVDLDGAALTDFLDEPYRHELDLECSSNGDGTYLCVFSAGSPRPDVFGVGDGYFVIFQVDADAGSIFPMWRYIGGDARVGASIHPSLDGQATIVSVLNQRTDDVELYRVVNGEVTEDQPHTVALAGGQDCVFPTDMIYNGVGQDGWVVTCRGDGNTTPGLLILRGLRGISDRY